MKTKLALILVLGCIVAPGLRASDHSDAPLTPSGPRPDANITDLHAFLVGQNLVLALATNPTIPVSAASYTFPTDVTFEINIDVDSAVDPSDPLGDGGTILDPSHIQEDVTFRITFDDNGAARVQRIGRRVSRGGAQRTITREGATTSTSNSRNHQTISFRGPSGAQGNDPGLVAFFVGLRDDPFIRGPRQGRNSGAIVLELPLASITDDPGTLLIWATSKVDDVEGPFHELAGRSLKSMFPENAALNGLHPKHHWSQTGTTPDVIIFDTAQAAAFPNGRALTDDVVNLVGDPRVLSNDAPFPTGNDRPFLTGFPYLATPHPVP